MGPVYAAPPWYRWPQFPREEAFDMPTKITIRPNGPYLVEGDCELIDVNGAKVDTSARGPRIALCRCGGSVTKPYCDGTHSKVGFQAAEAAVAQEKK
jgi:CDGSH-type Zn-finger protein